MTGPLQKVAEANAASITMQEVVTKQRAEIDLLRTCLVGARAALITAGFVGCGAHGTGDPEINAIDDVLILKRGM